MSKIIKFLLITTMLLLLFAVINLLSITQRLSVLQVVAKIVVFIGKGIGNIIFTPYTLLLILLFGALIKPNVFIKLGRKFSEIFTEIGIFKFRAPSPEQPVDPDTLPETIGTSKSGRPNQSDAIFFKELLTRNASTVICRFLLYAIDKPGRPANFTLKQLAEWTFGIQAIQLLEKEGSLNSLAFPSSLLIQTGLVDGSFTITGGHHAFESATVNSAAHQALEALAREGYQMTPQVKIN